ncbi:MAG: RDD family protein [Promethearchaeota archaeon]
MSLKYCPKCGNKLEPESRFCVSCGADLDTREEIAESTAYEEVPKKKVETSKISQEGVEYADFWPRFIAIIIDGIIIGIIGSSLSWLFFTPWIPVNIFDPFGGWWYTSFPFDWLIGFIYFTLTEVYNNGQSVGKMAMKLRTVNINTLEQAPSGNLAVNNILKPSGLIILDFIIGILKGSGEKNQYRIMQQVSETVVIRVK